MAIEFTLHHDSPSITNRDGHLRRPLEIVLISRVLGSMDSHIKGRYSMGTWDSCIAQALLGASRRWDESKGAPKKHGK
jgi:predicted nucleic acid-binding protein